MREIFEQVFMTVHMPLVELYQWIASSLPA